MISDDYLRLILHFNTIHALHPGSPLIGVHPREYYILFPNMILAQTPLLCNIVQVRRDILVNIFWCCSDNDKRMVWSIHHLLEYITWEFQGGWETVREEPSAKGVRRLWSRWVKCWRRFPRVIVFERKDGPGLWRWDVIPSKELLGVRYKYRGWPEERLGILSNFILSSLSNAKTKDRMEYTYDNMIVWWSMQKEIRNSIFINNLIKIKGIYSLHCPKANVRVLKTSHDCFPHGDAAFSEKATSSSYFLPPEYSVFAPWE